MDKKIKEIRFALENCESITVPYGCFKNFKFSVDKSKADEDHIRYITNLDCIIKDNGSMNYNTTWSGNYTPPVQRLSHYEDICWIIVYYDDNTEENYGIDWYSEGDYDVSQENRNQINHLIDYKTIHIKIEPYIPKYSITEIIDFEVGTNFKGEEDSQIYKIVEIKNEDKVNKWISNIIGLTEQQIKQSYIEIKSF